MTWPVPLPAETGDEVADLAAFAAWEQAVERVYHPDRFDADAVRLPEPHRFTFYVGAPEPSWLNRCDGVPKFVSAARFDRYRSEGERWPVTTWDPYAIDSGAYIALDGANTSTPWWLDRETYASKVFTYATTSGPIMPEFCAPQDWPCEPNVRKRTGLTVREHQQLTLESYLWLVEEWPQLPWIPVLQGWEAGEHADHALMYADAGVDLAACHRVGIGSVCRRAHLPEIVDVIAQFADAGLKLHGFGVKKTALPIIGHLLRSADSMAWSTNARKNRARLPGCTHAGDCRNCYRYAKRWREQVLASLTKPQEAAMSTATKTHKTQQPDLFAGLADFAALVAGDLGLTETGATRLMPMADVKWVGWKAGQMVSWTNRTGQTVTTTVAEEMLTPTGLDVGCNVTIPYASLSLAEHELVLDLAPGYYRGTFIVGCMSSGVQCWEFPTPVNALMATVEFERMHLNKVGVTLTGGDRARARLRGHADRLADELNGDSAPVGSAAQPEPLALFDLDVLGAAVTAALNTPVRISRGDLTIVSHPD